MLQVYGIPVVVMGIQEKLFLKGHNTQNSDHMGKSFFPTEQTIEIQLVRPTKVCGKV